MIKFGEPDLAKVWWPHCQMPTPCLVFTGDTFLRVEPVRPHLCLSRNMYFIAPPP